MTRPEQGTVLTTGPGKYGRIHYSVLAPYFDNAKGQIAVEIMDIPEACRTSRFDVGCLVYIDPRDIGPGKITPLPSIGEPA